MFSIMIAEGSWYDGIGQRVSGGTYRQVNEGLGVGIVHFYSQPEIKELFSKFEQVELNYKIRSFDDGKKKVKHWLVRAKK